MRALGVLLSVTVVLILIRTGSTQEKKATNKEKIIGTWTLKPAQPDGEEMTYEFTKDGKFTMAFTVSGKPRKLEGTFEVKTDSISLKLKGSTATEFNKIKTLTEKEMVWESQTETLQFKRAK